jgi:hypothetical protein
MASKTSKVQSHHGQTMRVEVFMILKQACPSEWPRGARCVQRFDDSLNSAIHITYRISLRSSSMREPRDPLLKVVLYCVKRGAHSIRLHYGVCVKT